MSSNYSVSTSESSSFCTNPTLHHTQSRHAPSDAAAGTAGRPHHRTEAAAATAASSTRSDVTPKKASQSSKSATATAAAQESPSMTIRRLPADYSKQMEDQKARSNALERYKMLVRANRLVPSDNEASPDPKKTKPAAEDEDADMSTTWRRSDVMPSSVQRDASVVSQTVLSDISDDDIGGGYGAGAAAAGAGGRKSGGPRTSQPRKSADPRPPQSASRRQQQQQQQDRRERSSSSPVSVSASVERPAYPASAVQRPSEEDGEQLPAAGPITTVPSIDLTKTLAHQPVSQKHQQQQQQQPASAVAPSVNRNTAAPKEGADGGESNEDTVDYVSPELTQPYSNAALKPRNSLRPGYEPITEHRSSSLTRTSSYTGEGPRTPRKQSSQQTQSPGSQVRTRSSAPQGRLSASPTGPSTPRRKSTAKARPAAAAASPPPAEAASREAVAAAKEQEKASRHADVNAGSAADAEADGEARVDDASQHSLKAENGVVPLPGSKTAFWIRPSSAMYEMTTSIAAKRKDHAEAESATTRTSSRRGSHTFHAIPSGSSSSLCGTPRTRDGANSNTAAAAAATEEKPRFSTHMTAADRKLYEENKAAAANPPAVSTYDAIFGARQSTVQRSSSRRAQKGPAASPATAAAGVAASTGSSTPRGTPRGNSKQRRAAPRAAAAAAVRSSSATSHLSSNPPVPTPSEEEVGRASTRQQDALTKHCARVAARGEEPVEAKARKTMKSAPAAQAPGPLKRSTAPAPAAAAEPEVQKRLEYEATTEATTEDDDAAEPVPQTVVPQQSTKRRTAPYHEANEEEDETAAAAAASASVPSSSSPHTTIHGRSAGEDTTPSKSRRREHDTTASPPRDDDAGSHNHHASSASAEAHFAEQEAVMAREKEAARAEQARAALESCRLARQARVEAARTSHSAGAAVSTNEVVAAMLQGLVQQTRQVLPCYLCGEPQCTSGYRVHISACRPKTEATLREYFTTVAGLADIPADITAHIESLAAQEVPLSTSDVAIRDAYAKACYQCVKSTLVPCRKCGTHLRVQDVKEHEMLCGRTYYQNSRAAERVRSAVDRIERGSQE